MSRDSLSTPRTREVVRIGGLGGRIPGTVEVRNLRALSVCHFASSEQIAIVERQEFTPVVDVAAAFNETRCLTFTRAPIGGGKQTASGTRKTGDGWVICPVGGQCPCAIEVCIELVIVDLLIVTGSSSHKPWPLTCCRCEDQEFRLTGCVFELLFVLQNRSGKLKNMISTTSDRRLRRKNRGQNNDYLLLDMAVNLSRSFQRKSKLQLYTDA